MTSTHIWRAVGVALAITTLVTTPAFADGSDGATTVTAEEPPPEVPSTTIEATTGSTDATDATEATNSATAPPSDSAEAPDTSIAPSTSQPATSQAATSQPSTSHPTTGPTSTREPATGQAWTRPTTDEQASTTSSTTAPPTSATSTSLPAGDQPNPDQSGATQSPTASTSPSTPGSNTTGSSTSNSGHPVATHGVDHSVEITSIQVSVSDTGNNTSIDTTGSGAQPTTTAASGHLATGSASAVGSRDASQLVQEAITELTNDASAEIVQISIAFNIGAAVANSGANALATGGGGASASITSGNAVAIGNDSQTFVTQGAGATAGANAVDTAQQSTMVLHLGVARSNTGANTIIATVTSSGPGSIGTGDASAIGNQSTTEIEQLAVAAGTNGGELTIRQRAAVINLGLALADSGSNAIGGALAAAIDTGESADFEQVLSLILPELLRTAIPATAVAESGSAPSGSAATGDAIAIGNRSTTAVQQVAVGSADGGSVAIHQDVVVVNAGVASATTGRNSIGTPAPTLDGESQVVVTQLAVFLSNLLERIDAWSSGDEVTLDGDSLSTSLGGLTIGLDSSLAANVLEGNAVSGATIRQLTAVINLAFALANTGQNTQTSSSTTFTADAALEASRAVATAGDVTAVPEAIVDGVSTVIVTGNASATNSMVLVVCQLSNVDLVCLGPDPEEQEPPTTQPPVVEQPVTPTPTTTPAQREVPSQPGAVFDPVVVVTPDPIAQPEQNTGRRGLLALTGGEPGTTLRIAAMLVLTGVALAAASKRRTPRMQPPTRAA